MIQVFNYYTCKNIFHGFISVTNVSFVDTMSEFHAYSNVAVKQKFLEFWVTLLRGVKSHSGFTMFIHVVN